MNDPRDWNQTLTQVIKSLGIQVEDDSAKRRFEIVRGVLEKFCDGPVLITKLAKDFVEIKTSHPGLQQEIIWNADELVMQINEELAERMPNAHHLQRIDVLGRRA